MNPNDIDKLVEKFFAGETSVMEEARLKDWIHTNEVPEHLASVEKYFEVMDQMGMETLDSSFDDRLFAKIDADQNKWHIRRWTSRLVSAAAAILILLAFWFGNDLFQPKQVYGTIEDPEIAFQETREVLDEVSKKMNQGLKPAKKTVEKVEENVNKANEMKKINKALEKTKGINKLERASEFLKSFNKVYVNYGSS